MYVQRNTQRARVGTESAKVANRLQGAQVSAVPASMSDEDPQGGRVQLTNMVKDICPADTCLGI